MSRQERTEQLGGVEFVYVVHEGDGHFGWQWSACVVHDGKRLPAHSPMTYTTVVWRQPVVGKMLRGPTVEERIEDGFRRAQSWALDNLAEWRWTAKEESPSG